MGNLRKERTFFLLKPDGVKKGLIGELIKRIENTGLKIIGLKVVNADRDLILQHLPKSDEWMTGMGNKTLGDYEKQGIDPKKEMGTDDALEIGKQIKEWLVEYYTTGPVVAGVAQGHRAIEIVRKVMGNTLPVNAEPGTFRGDYAIDSPALANAEKRAISNMTHASGDPDEAANEVQTWFKEEELAKYED